MSMALMRATIRIQRPKLSGEEAEIAATVKVRAINRLRASVIYNLRN